LLKKFTKSIDILNEATGKIFSWTVVVLNLLVVLEVVLRYVFNSPTIWNFEITKQVFALHFMITAGYGLLHNEHVSIDLVYIKLNKTAQNILDIITYLIFFFPFVGIIFFHGIRFAGNSWAELEKTTSVFGSPLFIIKTVIPVSALLLLLQGVNIFINRISYFFERKTSV